MQHPFPLQLGHPSAWSKKLENRSLITSTFFILVLLEIDLLFMIKTPKSYLGKNDGILKKKMFFNQEQ